jgi:predicted lipase
MNSKVTYDEITDLLTKCTNIYDENACTDKQYAQFFTDKATDFQAGIATLGDAVYCIFRGSNSLKDWYYDLTTNKIELQDGIKIHWGFYEQLHNHKCYDSMLKAMISYAINIEINKIYITGHSLGGALATLFAYELSKEMNKEITLVTFASPKIGNEKWVSAFDGIEKIVHVRVVNEQDPIPKSPIYNYYHCGEELFLESGEFHWRCYDVKKHGCDEYKKGLEKLETH